MIRVAAVAIVWVLTFAGPPSAQSTAESPAASTGRTPATPSPPPDPSILNNPRAGALAAGWVRIREEAPVRIVRDPKRVPLVVLHPGTKARVRDYKDKWLLVEFDDKRWGKRLGWVLESQCEW